MSIESSDCGQSIRPGRQGPANSTTWQPGDHVRLVTQAAAGALANSRTAIRELPAKIIGKRARRRAGPAPDAARAAAAVTTNPHLTLSRCMAGPFGEHFIDAGRSPLPHCCRHRLSVPRAPRALLEQPLSPSRPTSNPCPLSPDCMRTKRSVRTLPGNFVGPAAGRRTTSRP